MYSHFGSSEWVTPYGLIFLLAIGVSWCFARRNAGTVSIDGSHIDLLLPITIIAGVAGGILLSLAMPMDTMLAGERMQTGIRIRLFGFSRPAQSQYSSTVASRSSRFVACSIS